MKSRRPQNRPDNRPDNRPEKRAGRRPEQSADRPRNQNTRERGGSPAKDRARWVIGLHSCAETLKIRPRSIREIWLRADWASSDSLRGISERAGQLGILVREKAKGQLDVLGSGHQGVALACEETIQIDWSSLESSPSAVVLILDGLEDPHNLGSILRTAWLTGVAAILIPEERTVSLTPTVCKIASGGAEHVPVMADGSLPIVIERLKKLGFWIYGLSEAGQRAPWDFDLAGKVAWVIGSEGSGIRRPTERACDELIKLPQVASGSSYNASIACAMALIETRRQFELVDRQKLTPGPDNL